ncbi:hypothetical protein WS87_25070 [Burkholderia sp. MSMB0856]|uniref:hypothetical protein n=1 Tax=Burkholderia TaxID=32008 RepID=UPI0007559E2E|nr:MULTISPECIES: hypothetical protein [Burkholderia]AOJ89912.1 hypothetical protein WS87_25070 [Burkholderia sp. MSMB0856]KVH34775.1 hypothetical protein WS87_21380 [Burkholderia sp. MSMB0856]
MLNISATFHISADVAEPKVRGVRSGYAPHHRLPFIDHLFSGHHSYVDNDLHYPGEALKADIAFASWAQFSEHVKVGERIEVLELERAVGYLIVNEIYGHQG